MLFPIRTRAFDPGLLPLLATRLQAQDLAELPECSWQDRQTGYVIVFKSTNQPGKCAWCNTKNVTFLRNFIRNAGAGMNIAGQAGREATRGVVIDP